MTEEGGKRMELKKIKNTVTDSYHKHLTENPYNTTKDLLFDPH